MVVTLVLVLKKEYSFAPRVCHISGCVTQYRLINIQANQLVISSGFPDYDQLS